MTDLSPAAQVVDDAYFNADGFGYRNGLAAALRASVEQVVPEQGCQIYGLTQREDERQQVRDQLLAIAAELEGTDD